MREHLPEAGGQAPSAVEQFALAQAQAKLLGAAAPAVRLGRYVLLERLGVGGMGTVFSAYDPQLDRRIAIKLVHPGNSSSRASDRLAREARALAKLSHPNVITVFDAGIVGEDVFIAMELVEGKTLAHLMGSPRSWKEVREVLLPAARGLAAAHAAGLVHRDFKPSNVLIGNDGLVRVVDFGLARSLEGGVERRVSTTSSGPVGLLTTDGNLIGTPAYMAPEQLLCGITDARSDQFSYFVALYEALYGSRPFGGADMADLVRTVSALRIPSAPPRPGVPSWLHRAIVRGLAQAPGERHSSMSAAIQALQADRAIRRTAVVVLGSLLATALVAGTAIGALTPEVTDVAPDPVVSLVTEARAAAARSYFIYGPLDTEKQPTAFEIVLRLEAWEGDGAGAARTAAASLRNEFAETLERLGDRFWDREGGRTFSADYYAMALVFEPSRDRARVRTSLTYGELSSLSRRAADGDFSEAERLAGASLAALAADDSDEQARRVAELAQRKRPPAPTTLARLEDLVGAQPEPAAAPPRPRTRPKPAATEEPRVASTPEAEPSPAKVVPRRAKELAAEAKTVARGGDHKEAERLYRQALRANPSSSLALSGLAQLFFDAGAYHKALGYARRAAKAAPRQRRIQLLLGDVAFRVDYYDESKRAYLAARKLGSKTARSRLAYLESRLGDD